MARPRHGGDVCFWLKADLAAWTARRPLQGAKQTFDGAKGDRSAAQQTALGLENFGPFMEKLFQENRVATTQCALRP